MQDFPRIPLAVLSTPIQKLENISRLLNTNVYIKRDDLTGIGLGGNKVRKLEFLLADAKRKGAEVAFTTGGAQSNHAMLTAACAKKLGMEPILILKKRGVTERKGNQLLELDFTPTAENVHLIDMCGPGYAIPSPEGNAAIRMMAENEGLFLDPVYTGNAFAGLVKMAREGQFKPTDNVLYLYSGGAGGLFAIDIEKLQPFFAQREWERVWKNLAEALADTASVFAFLWL